MVLEQRQAGKRTVYTARVPNFEKSVPALETTCGSIMASSRMSQLFEPPLTCKSDGSNLTAARFFWQRLVSWVIVADHTEI